MLKFKRFLVTSLSLVMLLSLVLLGWVGAAQQASDVQEFALIHDFTVSAGDFKANTVTLPETVTVEQGKLVSIFNVTADPDTTHDPIFISSTSDGMNPVFDVRTVSGPQSQTGLPGAFRVEPGKVTIIEFTPDQTGTFFITHVLHGHSIVGKLIVK